MQSVYEACLATQSFFIRHETHLGMKAFPSMAVSFILFSLHLAALWPSALCDVGYGYRVTSTSGDLAGNTFQAVLTSKQQSLTFGPDIAALQLHVSHETDERIHVRITENDPSQSRWEVPQTLIDRQIIGDPSMSRNLGLKDLSPSPPQLQFSYTSDPFGFAIIRQSSGEVLFNSTPPVNDLFGNMVFKDQYLEISTSLPTSAALYGLGESTRPAGFRLSPGHIFTLWNSDIASKSTNVDLYGSYPFYMDARDGGNVHGVLLLNSNGMDVSYQGQYLTYKVIGGILDFYFFSGPTPLSVVDQYTELIGRPAPMPYWSLGFHQCRWGYKNVTNLQTVVANYKEKNIPLEVMWNDIDYMDHYKDFTLDPVNYPQSQLRAFVDQLHADNQHYVMIVDPGIKNEQGYATFTRGMQADIFIKQGNGQPYLGQVWPGPVYFPDFLHPDIGSFWTSEISNFHQIIPFDGLWIDMNEASNFCSGISCSYPSTGACPGLNSFTDCCLVCNNDNATQWDNPPYHINNSGDDRPLGNKTIATSAVHHGGVLEYNAHNLFGLTEAIATNKALKSVMNKRPFVLSRSTFVGSGAYTAHWTGDNGATWDDLGYSIVSIMNSGLVGIPMVGADICGFGGDTTEELCNRWIQLGAFYPFSRDHSDIDSISQELYLWDSVAQSARKALGLRYQLLPYLYTLVYEAHTTGAPIARPLFFSFPYEAPTYNVNSQFLLGSGVLVSPVLSSGATSVSAYFPKGTWYNLFDYTHNLRILDGSYQTLDAPLDTINVHIHQGSIVPMQESALTTAAVRQSPFTLLVALPVIIENANDTAIGKLYIDDGEQVDMELEDGKSSLIQFYASRTSQSVSVSSVVTYGNFALNGGWNLHKIVVLGMSSSPSNITINGQAALPSINATFNAPVLEISGLSLQIGNSFQLSWQGS